MKYRWRSEYDDFARLSPRTVTSIAVTSIVIVLLVIAGCAPVSAPYAAPGEEGAPQRAEIQAATDNALPGEQDLVQGSSLLDYTVTGRSGEQIGQVEDLFIDVASGQVLYTVLRFDEAMTEGGLLYPIPAAYTLAISKEGTIPFPLEDPNVLENAPAYTKAELPNLFSDPGLSGNVNTFWQNAGLPGLLVREDLTTPPQDFTVTPYALYGTGVRMMPGTDLLYSELIGEPIVDVDGAQVAEVTDIVVAPKSGLTPFFMVRQDGAVATATEAEEMVSVMPIGVLTYNTVSGDLNYTLDQQTLEQAPGFSASAWDEFATDFWNQEVRGYWNDAAPVVGLRAGARILPGTTMRVSDLFGYGVTNLQGDILGTIEDFVVSLDDGNVPYVVIQFGGFWDIGDEQVLLPTNALSLDRGTQSALIGVSEDTVQNAPTLANEALPDTYQPDWDAAFQEYWQEWMPPRSITPGGETDEGVDIAVQRAQPAILASDLIGYAVQNVNETQLGEIEDLMLNLEDGQVAYAVLSAGGFLEIGEDYYAIPIEQVTPTLESGDDVVIFNVDPGALESMPGFDKGDWPDTSNPRWDDEILNFWRSMG